MPAQATGILSRFQGKLISLFRIKKGVMYQTVPNVIFNTNCRKWLFLDSFDTSVPNVIVSNQCCFGVVLVLFCNGLLKRHFCEQQ